MKQPWKRLRGVLFTALSTLILFLASFTPLDLKPDIKLRTIVIDAGHGGKDPGCLGVSKTHESKIALAIAKETGRIIEQNLKDVKVIYTRTEDKFVELHQRASIANKAKADLFISIHCNAGPNWVKGPEVYTEGMHKEEQELELAKRENSVIRKEKDYHSQYNGFEPDSDIGYILRANEINTASSKLSLNLADKINEDFKVRVKRPARGVKQAGFLVLWETNMPSVLVEVGYLTNSTEESYLKQKANQVLLASGIYRAVKGYKQELD